MTLYNIIKNADPKRLQEALNTNAFPPSQIISGSFFRESPLQFAISKTVNEIHEFINHNKALNGGFSPHLKIATLLTLYDYCKAKAPALLQENFAAQLQKSIVSKGGNIQNTKNVGDFITQLVTKYKHSGDEFKIELDGYNLGEDLHFYALENSKSQFTISTDGEIKVGPSITEEDHASLTTTSTIVLEADISAIDATTTTKSADLVGEVSSAKSELYDDLD